MKVKNRAFLLFSFFLFAVSCNQFPDTLEGAELSEWYNHPKNGYVVVHEINGIVYKLKRVPLDLKILKNNKSAVLSSESYEAYAQQLGGMDYYELQINSTKGADVLKNGVPTDNEYLRRVDYLSFKAKNDFALKQGDKEVSCQLYHFERSYGLGKHVTINLAFPKAEASEYVLIFKDNVFGAGYLKFRFETDKGPKLKRKV